MNKMVDLLQHFYEMIKRIYGSLYVTLNTLVSKISNFYFILNEWKKSDDLNMRTMGLNMKQKFDKYWRDPKKMNNLIFIAFMLDPKGKFEYLSFSVSNV